MFFTPELLARRDSGFGLLWLAATLGNKSSFKKLPRRSVLTADISQLCELIAQPEEPLALRLSSNLMVGVARVYKIKQEIFMNDVTNCVTSLKKVVQEIQTAAAKDALQMASNTRPSAFTIAADPQAMYLMEFDDFVADWDEFLNIQEPATRRNEDEDEDQEYNPSRPKKSKQKNSAAKPPPIPEEVRADMVTLKEHHDHLLSNSFDLSLPGSAGGGRDVSSSQAEPAFALDDSLFPGIDEGLGIDFGLGDELARELGEGWGASPIKSTDQDRMDVDEPLLDPIPLGDGGAYIDQDFMLGGDEFGLGTQDARRHVSFRPLVDLQIIDRLAIEHEREGKPETVLAGTSSTSTTRKSCKLLCTAQGLKKSQKRTRLLLDARTELTDDEIKIARAQYLSEQLHQKREVMNKKLEKDSGKVIEDLIWSVPGGIEAPELIDFWQENFKVQVEARTGLMHLHLPALEAKEPPAKRRKVRTTREEELEDHNMQMNDVEMGRGDEGNFFDFDAGWKNDIESRLRSSEEPGQARRASKPPSDIGANFSFDLGSNGRQEGSQRSSLFPWDNAGAGPTSSADAFGGGSDRISIDRAEIRMRGSSFSRRESSLVPSQTGSAGNRGISPGDIGIRGSQVIGEDFVFSGVEPENTQTMNTQTMNTNTQMDSQKSDLNLITLERNSFNFLEYAKMQQASHAYWKREYIVRCRGSQNDQHPARSCCCFLSLSSSGHQGSFKGAPNESI
ncbi:hypothetical protein BT96DRAFT_1013571 [Gymnopus androsaceus JB14]|uniref:Rad21/Rec8-like protein N-terminal domain-containing protein n=1 Tax=Gymnopus androsaceus JB14 TaxID=1447944 RepID=A0A6A4IDL8_9AGAR|nr:hypothetical protein BT96DRAFT_1013571 [Gymnopus androsaceus JB14]